MFVYKHIHVCPSEVITQSISFEITFIQIPYNLSYFIKKKDWNYSV